MNKPYLPQTLTAVEELLLARVAAAETAMGYIAQLIARHTPSLADEIGKIIHQATVANNTGEEIAAAVLLQGEAVHAPGLELASQSFKRATEFERRFGQYLPRIHGELSPLGLDPRELFATFGETAPFERAPFAPLGKDGAYPTYPELAKAVKTRQNVKLTSSLLTAGMTPQPLVFSRLEVNRYVVFNILSGNWAILVFLDTPGQEHFFLHHNLEYTAPEAKVEDFFTRINTNLPKKLLNYYIGADQSLNRFEELVTRLWSNPEPKQMEIRTAKAYHLNLTYGAMPMFQGKHVLSIESAFTTQLMIYLPANDFMLVGSPTNGRPFQQVKLRDLPAVSQRLLVEALERFMDVKAAPAKAVKKTAKKRVTKATK